MTDLTIDLDRVRTMLLAAPPLIEALFAGIGDEVATTRPSPDEWSPVECLGHLITCDRLAFHDRIRVILDEDEPVLPRFDADEAAAERGDRDRGVSAVLAEFREAREHYADAVASLDRADLDKVAVGPEGMAGISAWDFVLEWPHHDHDHLTQMTAAVNVLLRREMGDDMASALAPPA